MCSMRFLSGHFLNLLLEHLVSKMAIVIILSMLLNILIENTKICKKKSNNIKYIFFIKATLPQPFFILPHLHPTIGWVQKRQNSLSVCMLLEIKFFCWTQTQAQNSRDTEWRGREFLLIFFSLSVNYNRWKGPHIYRWRVSYWYKCIVYEYLNFFSSLH